MPVLIVLLLLGGCVSFRLSDPPRSANSLGEEVCVVRPPPRLVRGRVIVPTDLLLVPCPDR